MDEMNVILLLGMLIRAGIMRFFYVIIARLPDRSSFKLLHKGKPVLYGLIFLLFSPMVIMPLYYHCPSLAQTRVGSLLRHHPLVAGRLLEASHAHHQKVQKQQEDYRESLVMRRT